MFFLTKKTRSKKKCIFSASLHRCNKFLHARTFFTLADTTSIVMFAMYLHARMFCTLAPYIFYSHWCTVRAWNLFWASVAKQVLWVDITALYTPSYVFYSHGCNKFLHARTFFTLDDTITPIFTVITEVWPCANRAMVTNN